MLSSFFESEVAVEQSPLEEIPFRALIDKSANVAIGTYVGWSAAEGKSLLLLATVPAGIIAVGAAIGISKGLMNGLNKSIERAVKGAAAPSTPSATQGNPSRRSARKS